MNDLLTFNEAQRRAIAAKGLVFVSAGAGTGKTRVLVERFATEVLERGVAPDRVLAITYTDRAAAELIARIRERLADEQRPDLERALDGSWISTIHAFCRRLLRRYALVAGLDPGFEVLSGAEAELLRDEAYDAGLEQAIAADDDILDVVAAYGEPRLRAMVVSTHEKLRTAGRPVAFPPALEGDFEAAGSAAAAAARAMVADEGQQAHVARWRAQAEALIELLDGAPAAEALVDLSAYRAGTAEVAQDYRDAVAALERAARDVRYAELQPRLDALLAAFATAYAARKRAGSWLDFDDLQLRLRDLLDEHAEVRAEVRGRFDAVLVDEFQDTNELQCAIVDRVTGEDASLFFVGDEFQSIYRFRHADVAVFQRRHAAARDDPAAHAVALRTNYRSRPEVLAVVNHLFAKAFGADYAPLEPGGAFPGLQAAEPAVEFIVTDAERADAAGQDPREVEARAIARRLKELVDAGTCTPGEIVLLFAATGDADLYERALVHAGLETVSATGRRYYEAQPVRDVLSYLQLLRNRYDDVALLEVLASPLVGVSNDTLSLLRANTRRGPIFGAVEHALPGGLREGQTQLLAAFRQRFDRLSATVGRIELARLVERVVEEHDFDLALLRTHDGTRRFANLRKLARLARDYEALHGPDLEGFATNVEVRALAATPEADAAVSEENEHAVRLMTVHAAKGLQFPVVVVADSGRGARGSGDDLVALPDGRVGLKVPAPSGRLVETRAYEDARRSEADADLAERRRVTYVALTRAIDRLIVSGVVNSRTQSTAPLGWMLEALEIVPGDEDRHVEVAGSRVLVRAASEAAEPPGGLESEAPVDVDGQLALFGEPEEVEPLPPPADPRLPEPLAALPEPPPPRPGRLSFSSLHLYERCGLRFYAERVLGLPARRAAPSVTEDGGGLGGAEIGTVVHELLETGARGDAVALATARYPHAAVADAERIRLLVEAWDRSELAARVAATAQVEVPFMLDVAGAVVVGRLDLVAEESETLHVVDFKTNRLGEDDDPRLLRDDEYGLQEAVYALALLRRGGHERVEVHFAFLDRRDVVTSVFGPGDAARLEARVSAAVHAALGGPYLPRPGVACAECPALGLFCAGPELEALHAPSDA